MERGSQRGPGERSQMAASCRRTCRLVGFNLNIQQVLSSHRAPNSAHYAPKTSVRRCFSLLLIYTLWAAIPDPSCQGVFGNFEVTLNCVLLILFIPRLTTVVPLCCAPRHRRVRARKGVSTDSLKFHAGSPCSTLTRPAGWPPPKRPYSCLGGGRNAGRSACGRLLPPWIPHAVRACRDTRPRLGLNFVSALLMVFWFWL
jgi:hypothetical protein